MSRPIKQKTALMEHLSQTIDDNFVLRSFVISLKIMELWNGVFFIVQPVYTYVLNRVLVPKLQQELL